MPRRRRSSAGPVKTASSSPEPAPRVAAEARPVRVPLPWRSLIAALGIAGFVFAATADERVFGLVTDGKVMVRTAVSMAELGEIGIGRGQLVDVKREGGDAVSRYGM